MRTIRILLYFIFISICFLTFLISCGSISSSSDRFKNVDVADVVKETDISSISTSNCKTIRMSRDDEHVSKTSDIFDSVEYIPLSNAPDAIIGAIDKIIVSNNSFFIHDRWKTSSVKRFGLDGSYITTIGNRGQGPKDYLDATDFAIQDSLVLLYDSYQDKPIRLLKKKVMFLILRWNLII